MSETLNFLIFIGVMIFITILIKNTYNIDINLKNILHSKGTRENFKNMANNSYEFKPLKTNTIPLKKEGEYRGWNKYYRENFMGKQVESGDSFAGTNFRNYLDNMKFFHN